MITTITILTNRLVIIAIIVSKGVVITIITNVLVIIVILVIIWGRDYNYYNYF